MNKLLLIACMVFALAACDENDRAVGSGDTGDTGGDPGETTTFSLQAPAVQARDALTGNTVALETVGVSSARVTVQP